MTERPSRRLRAPTSVACAAAVTLALAPVPVGAQGRAGGRTETAAQPLAAGRAPTVAPLPASALDALRYRFVGPFRAGRVLATAGIPGNASTFYLGSVDGGVWRTENAGVTWAPLTDGTGIASVGALAVAPSDPRVLYVGAGEVDMRSDITYGDGVYRSDDGGAHWRHLGLEDTRQIGKVLVDPKDPNTVLVAALGHAYGPNPERGVYRSADGGRTWQKVLYRDESTGAVDLAWDEANPSVVYATTWNARRPPWSQYPPDEGPGSGVWKSTDEGRTWRQVVGGGFPAGKLGRIGVAAGDGGRRVYALVEAAQGGGLYRSDDAGATWRLVSEDPRITTRGWYFGQIFLDPTNPDVVYAPNRGIVRSADGGRTWETIKGEPGGDDYHTLWIDPREPRRMIQGSDQGAGVSLDGGRTWSSWYNQPTAQFYHVVTDDQFPYRIYGAQQDAGSVAILSRSDLGQITFRDWFMPGAGEAGYVAPDPADPDVVFGGDTYGSVYRFDRRTGQRQDVSPAPAAPFGTPMEERKYRFTWTSPLVFDPRDPHTLYFGAQKVLKTTDGGLHWQEISPDLTGMQPSARGRTGPLTVADASARGHGVVYTIAPSAAQAGVIWAGTDDGRIQLTEDGGAHWRDVTPVGLRPWSKVSILDAARGDAATAYAAVDRHRLDDVAPYIYRTHDSGAHWTPIVAGIPNGAYVRAVRADPVAPGLLYAGTEMGVYVSFDDGDHWQPLGLNLPRVAVHDLIVHGNDLVLATHGRGFWVLDDVSPLRELTGDVASADVHLFRPADAVRLRRSVNFDTPLPPEEPHGENPPAGAVLDWWLKAPATGPVTLEILDASGRVVRRIAGGETPPPPSEPPYFADEWLPRAQPLTAHAGLNRFVWDLRYPRPPADAYDYTISAVPDEGTVAVPEGPLVAPGTYQVRLTVAGHTETQPLRVTADPRARAGADVYAAQLRAALEVWNAMADAHALAVEVDSVRARLAAARQRSPRGDVASAAAALERALQGVRPGAVGGAMGGLLDLVDGADREPPAQALEAFAGMKERLEAQRAQWTRIERNELAKLNAALRAAGIAAIEAPAVEAERVGDGR
ncbi:MAG TPA: hypothetical protein VFQ38_10295 [Longimicrobiales bacterium]|nr:hypothetical protein [Longimicrobiales bacterium]